MTPPILWDTHGHLQDPAFDEDREAAYQRAAERGIGVIIPGYTLESSRAALALAERWPGAWAQVGVHPHETDGLPADWLEQLAGWARHPRVAAIGEIGLDYYHDLAPRAAQRAALGAQLGLARSMHLPVAIHCREAWADVVAAIREVPGTEGVLHCFTGNREQARPLLDLGFFLSFAGPVTFSSGDTIREVVRWAPGDRVLVETDAPYMAPVPHRGHRNEPRWVEDTAMRVVRERGQSPEEGFLALVANTMQAFSRLSARDAKFKGQGVDGSTGNC